MGCVSSKQIKKELKQEEVGVSNGGGYVNHVVSLTSSTYGALMLDKEQPTIVEEESKTSPPRPPEVINTWELMEGLEEGVPITNNPKKSPKSTPFLRAFIATDPRPKTTPLRFLNQFGSPKSLKKFTGKENKLQPQPNAGVRRLDYNFSPKGILKPSNLSSPLKDSPIRARRNSFGSDTKRRSPSPLFDPELLASYEKELTQEQEQEQIKRMVWATPRTRRFRKSLDSQTLINTFEEKCPPRGGKCVVIYTTTLRGIRKTFEECNKVRAIVESYCVHMVERDVSMDSGFKEELLKLMGTKQVKVPIVFVKGRLVGGAEDVVKLEEEGKLGVLFDGIPPKALGECKGCGGERFLVCVKCNGSCKVLDEDSNKTVRCGHCNENGLIQCPMCP